MAQEETRRLRYVDIVRGVAILSIILGHLDSTTINRIVFTFHVPIFYLVTGYFLSARAPFGDFVRKRARTLLVPYAVTALIVGFGRPLTYMLLPEQRVFATELGTWLYAALCGIGSDYLKPFYMPAIGAIWFLWSSFWASCALRWLLDKKPWQQALASLGAFLVGVCMTKAGYGMPLSLLPAGAGLFFMYLGHLWRGLYERIRQAARPARLALFVVALAVWARFILTFEGFYLVVPMIGRGLVDVVGCLCGCYVIARVCEFYDSANLPLAQSLAWAGEHSLIILCIHEIELYLLPWHYIDRGLVSLGCSPLLVLILKIVAKLVIILTLSCLALRSRLVQRLFGYRPTA